MQENPPSPPPRDWMAKTCTQQDRKIVPDSDPMLPAERSNSECTALQTILMYTINSFFETQSGPFKLDLVSIATIPDSSTASGSVLDTSSSVGVDCESTTSTLKGEARQSEGKQDPENQKSSARQGFWSRFSCL